MAGERFCWPIPDGLPTEAAACVPIAVRHRRRLPVRVRPAPGRRDGAGPGRRERRRHRRHPARHAGRGARCSPPPRATAKLERLAEFGLDHGINYATGRLRRRGAAAHRRPRRRPRRRYRSAARRCRAACAAWPTAGRCVSVGDAGREPGTAARHLDPAPGNNQTLTGYFLGAELFFGDPRPPGHRPPPGRHRQREPARGHRPHLPARQAAAAHAYIESRQAFGRVLLVP